MNSDHPDSELMDRIVKGNQQAFELLYHQFYSRLYRFIARITRKPELIEEIVNDVMFVVWEKAATYNGQCRVSTWIFGIAFNKARQTLRNAYQEGEFSIDDPDEEGWEPGYVDDGPLWLETGNWLEYALGCLSIEQRTVVELTFYQELHYHEIAEVMGCSENTVKTRMHYARKKMASYFKENGLNSGSKDEN